MVQLQAQEFISSLAPKMSIQTPSVKLVDANLAYKYADLQSDTNIFLSIGSGFLGFALSSIVTLVIAFFIPTDKMVIALYLAFLVMGVISTSLFGFLFYRAYRKAEATKKQLNNDAGGEKEIELDGAVTKS